MNTKTTALLFISLWALSCARPVSRHQGAHRRSSEEHWPTAIEGSLNEVADSTDVSDEDPGSRLSVSTESQRRDDSVNKYESTSHESSEGNNFLRKGSRISFERSSEDDHEWSPWDNDGGNYFRLHHQAVQRKWADDKDSHEHGDSSDFQSADRMSLEDQNEIHEDHLYNDIRKSKEQFDVENDGMLYTPDQVLYTFTGKGASDLTYDEDISGDDLDGHNEEATYGKDVGHTVPPYEGGDQQTSVTNGGQDGHNAIGRHHDGSSSSSSSSSSESRELDKENNHITDYGKRHGSDSYSSSQEDRYDFDDEGMQGDDPRIFESLDSDSRMLHGDVHSKESSQESSRENGKGKAKHHSKSVEHFARKVYHYADGDSDEDHSPEQDENKSLQEDDAGSKEESQSIENISQLAEKVPSRSREHGASRSREAVERSSRGHSHSKSRENFDSQSREDLHSRSREVRHSQSREDVHSQSREDVHSRSREDVHSRSREDVHSQSREDVHSQSTEDVHSQSTEDVHSQSREDIHSQSREDTNSQSREHAHSQSRELMPSQSTEDENSQSREDNDTASVEDIKSESTEDSRSSHEETVRMSKEISDRSDEHSASKSKEQDSDSTEVGKVPPRGGESREFKRQHSRSSENSKSTEESKESPEDTDESSQSDSRLSHSTSSESSKESQDSASSEDSDSNDLRSEEWQDQHSQSTETSESKGEENSYSIERHSQSREDTMSNSDSTEDKSWSRSMELESRKLMLDIYHNKPFSDYDDNDCQDGY
ncbi:dentin matrix acidic phosphoprotein 1 [Rhineura floridana]|uniref:dentin matrix acidic phosphoprotein 1 n=1 Tax=Rhineura floridana TaxID=261503 RepID=UPI002AC878AB|nr:dentin matrix acidic phosphoprotein 1 [Rhineura floridana]